MDLLSDCTQTETPIKVTGSMMPLKAKDNTVLRAKDPIKATSVGHLSMAMATASTMMAHFISAVGSKVADTARDSTRTEKAHHTMDTTQMTSEKALDLKRSKMISSTTKKVSGKLVS